MKRSIVLIASALLAFPGVRGEIRNNLAEHSSPFTESLAPFWSNVALSPFRYSSSLTDISLGAGLADDLRYGCFDASTWLTSPKSLITGFTSYVNSGRWRNQLTETVDADIVGPYQLFADGNGSLKEEVYSFGGSYTSLFGKWNVGVSGAYKAGLSYRTVDPRPRNITGTLFLSSGTSISVNRNYLLGVNLEFIRYKQSSAISFVSEYGQNTVYHLTGLGTVYDRFTGQGLSTYYSGYSFGCSFGLLPRFSGIFANLKFDNLSLRNMLDDLNKLPMAKTFTPKFEVSGGWRSQNRTFGLLGCWERRRGSENIFGDAVSGQYPQIASLTLYSRTRRYAGIQCSYETSRFSALAKVKLVSSFEQQVSSMRELDWKRIEADVSFFTWFPIGKCGYLGATVSGCSSTFLSRRVSGFTPALLDGELQRVVNEILSDYHLKHGTGVGGKVNLEFLFQIKDKFMLGLSAVYSYSFSLSNQNQGDLSFRFVF